MFARVFGIMAALFVSGGAQAAPAQQQDVSIEQRLASAQIKIKQITDIAASDGASSEKPKAGDRLAQHHWNNWHNWRDHHHR